MKKIRRYHCVKEIYDTTGQKHTILVYGELEQTNEDHGFVIAPVTYAKRGGDIISVDDKYNIIGYRDTRPTRKFNFGWAICDSNDEFDLARGIKLAKRRFSDSPMTTTDVRFFSDDMIKVVLVNEVDFIINHIEKYIPGITVNFVLSFEKSEKEKEQPAEETKPEHVEQNEDNKTEYERIEENLNKNENRNNSYKCADKFNPCLNSIKDEQVEQKNHTEETKEKKGVENTINFLDGDFISFYEGGLKKYAVVKQYKDGYIYTYWTLTKIFSGWHLETEKKHKVDELYIRKRYSKREVFEHKTFNWINSVLRYIFGYEWHVKNSKLRKVRHSFPHSFDNDINWPF